MKLFAVECTTSSSCSKCRWPLVALLQPKKCVLLSVARWNYPLVQNRTQKVGSWNEKVNSGQMCSGLRKHDSLGRGDKKLIYVAALKEANVDRWKSMPDDSESDTHRTLLLSSIESSKNMKNKLNCTLCTWKICVEEVKKHSTFFWLFDRLS